MPPLWHTHVFSTSVHRLRFLTPPSAPCYQVYSSSNSMLVCQLMNSVVFNQLASFLLYNTTSYLPQLVSAILRCMRYTISVYVSFPWIFLSIAKQKGFFFMPFQRHTLKVGFYISLFKIHSWTCKAVSHSSSVRFAKLQSLLNLPNKHLSGIKLHVIPTDALTNSETLFVRQKNIKIVWNGCLWVTQRDRERE